MAEACLLPQQQHHPSASCISSCSAAAWQQLEQQEYTLEGMSLQQHHSTSNISNKLIFFWLIISGNKPQESAVQTLGGPSSLGFVPSAQREART